MISVRDARPSDAEAIASIHVRGWQHAYRGVMPDEVLDGMDERVSAEGWRGTITATIDDVPFRSRQLGDELVVAVQDERVVGWAGYGSARRDLDGMTGELHGIYADPERIGGGVGHALIGHVEQRLRAAGHERAYLLVLVGNDPAARFYERHGWRETGDEIIDERPHMNLRLTERVRAKDVGSAPAR